MNVVNAISHEDKILSFASKNAITSSKLGKLLIQCNGEVPNDNEVILKYIEHLIIK